MSEHTQLPEVQLSPRRLRLAAVIGVLVFGSIAVIGTTTRIVQARNLHQWTDEQAIPTVLISEPENANGSAPLELPAQMDAFTNAPIYARTSGYLKSWAKDIGAPVKAGDVLGIIDTPDLDQQLLQAQADLATAKANATLAATTAKRWQVLRQTDPDSVSQQSVDQYNGDLAAKQAQVNASQANLDRLKALKSYAKLVAPFDGRVTARNTDVGALITADSSGTGTPLFTVSDTSKLRVYVRVPQVYAPAIHKGDDAELTVPEYPGKSFTAKVEADARAITPTSGTTLVQLLVDNPDGKLLPSSYASLKFKIGSGALGLRVPAEALIFDDKGLHVATLDASDHAHFKTVTIRRDYGKTIEIGSGLEANDRVIINPPDGLADGDEVRIAKNPQAGKPHDKA
ncbi:RND family efflux transporter, MFP subunit [Dyella jiangningensis]|uniref:efflux RND transporter periplasmic adaptor subunit n=1 Tax=Dyella sp. AtDHG13 TaxID=1938897 RepID=UPI00088500CF|nr:efflux RND transporter periplasmic adaptor subunit [Dyella sp. AtDHG13]PXV57374.1 RND family efflux transporter MFP subunit [Dyella sp. AtDHG13]SDK42260.1 RND family efflux transporter, MFP subunit [Dyella jiangningensis]